VGSLAVAYVDLAPTKNLTLILLCALQHYRCDIGTFLLRFSDSSAGSLAVAYVDRAPTNAATSHAVVNANAANAAKNNANADANAAANANANAAVNANVIGNINSPGGEAKTVVLHTLVRATRGGYAMARGDGSQVTYATLAELVLKCRRFVWLFPRVPKEAAFTSMEDDAPH
jgi:hypothetical protein